MARMLMIACALALLPACDLFSGLGANPVPLILATDGGEVIRLDTTDEDAVQSWGVQVPPSASAALLVDGAAVYAASGSQLVGLDLESGDALWTAPLDLGGTAVRVVGPIDGRVFVLTFDDLIAADTASGQELWRQDLNLTLSGAADAALAAGGGALILGGSPIRAIDPATGDVLATFGTPDSDIRALAVSGGSAYAGLLDGLVALDASSLALRWRVDSAAQVDNLAVDGSAVVYSVLGGGIATASLDGAPGGATADGEIFQHVGLDPARLLGVRADGLLAAWDRASFSSCALGGDCPTAWEVPGSSPAVDALALGASSTVYVSAGGILEAVIASDGGALWSYQAQGAIVAIEVP